MLKRTIINRQDPPLCNELRVSLYYKQYKDTYTTNSIRILNWLQKNSIAPAMAVIE